MVAKVFLFLCLSLLLFQTFAKENFETVNPENDLVENPDSLRFWHPRPLLRPRPRVHPPLPAGGWHWHHPRVHPPLPSGWRWPHPPLRGPHPHLPFRGGWHGPHPPLPSKHFDETFTSEKNEAKNPNGLPAGGKRTLPRPHPPLPSWLPKTKWPFPHPPLPSWLPKTKWPFPHPPLPSWLPKTKWPFPHPPLPSWLPKTKRPFPHPPLPSWLPKNRWHFPGLPPLPSGGCKWPWLPHHNTKTLEDNKALETKCPSTPAAVENCMKEGTYSFSDTNGYTFSTECCKSIAEIKDECSDELYVPVIKYQCSSRA